MTMPTLKVSNTVPKMSTGKRNNILLLAFGLRTLNALKRLFNFYDKLNPYLGSI